MSQHPMAMQQGMGAGGPVAAPVNAGTPSSSATIGPPQDIIKKLNTAIYDYLLCSKKYDAARAVKNCLDIETADQVKQSPNQPNGVDSGMDVDSKEHIGIQKRPDDLPMPNSLSTEDSPFLQDWWCQFWELYHGNRQRGKPTTINYVGQQRTLQKQRTGIMAGADPNAAQRGYMMNNGAMGDLRQAAMKNGMNPVQIAQMRKMQSAVQGNQMQGAQMERQGSQMDMGGPRSGSPNTAGDAPSPKRQRLDGGAQQMGQARPGQPGQMPGNQVGTPTSSTPSFDDLAPSLRELLLKHRIDLNSISPDQLKRLSAQPTNIQTKSVEVYSQGLAQQMQQQIQRSNSNTSNKGMPPNPAMGPGGAQSSPMAQQGLEANTNDFYGANRMGMPQNGAPAQAPGQQGSNQGNHALQDYQMQLMLLEQQNKKRLLMARQEQDSMAHPSGVPGPNGGQFAPGMSPQGSRGGDPSPNPNDMQRGTPNMKKPGMSPNGEMAGRGSPTPGMMDPNVNPQMRQQPQMMMGPNGQPMMRPPSSHPQGQPISQQQIEMMRQNGQIMPNGQPWQGGPQPPQMMPGQQPTSTQPGQPPNMTPRQGNMPPPPAPAGTQAGTQPSSPAQPPAPPTPSQAPKNKPGTKKETAASKKAAANNKKGAAAAAAAAANDETVQPPTPTPPPPMTPNNAASFNQNKNLQMPNGQPAPNQQPNANGPQSSGPQQQPPQSVPEMNAAPFGALGGDDQFSGMDFATLDSGDVLDNFDFDSFLNNTGGDEGFGFDANLAFGDGEGIDISGN